MKTRNIFAVSLLAVLMALTLMASASMAQTRTPVVVNKYTYAAVSKAATGDLWTTGQPSLNYNSALIHIVNGGTAVATGCVLKVYTGPTAALATTLADDMNNVINCVGDKDVLITSLNNYFNINLAALSGGTDPTISVTVTLTNTLGFSEKQFKPTSSLTALAANTITEVIAAPAAGIQTYLEGVLIEKTSGATGTYTLSYGTGTNCGTGTTVLLGPVSVFAAPKADQKLGIKVPAAKAVCVTTDGAGTGIRLLYR